MTWIELVDPAQAEGELADAFAAGEAVYGKVLEAWKAVAHVDGAFPAYLPYLRRAVGPGQVDPRIKDLAAIRVGMLNGCRYSVSHRVASARKAGVPEEDILGVADPERAGFDERLSAALAFAEELTLAPPAVPPTDAPQAVSDATLARIKAAFDDAEIAELALSVSLWNALSRFHRVLALELDMPEPPAALDPALP
jgi:AhpD family alkylhydroperoxidase